jgi:hypothetical protein
MSSLTDLFNPTFFMFLGVTLLVAALLTSYFESKLREQNHKLTTMLSLVSSLAEELNGNKFAVNHLLNQMSVNGGGPINVIQQNLEKTIVKKDMHELIEVSDDSESDDDEEEESLSDDEDNDMDSDNDSDNETDNETNAKTVVELIDNNDNVIKFGALSDIKIFKINNQDEELQEENDFDDMPDLESISSESIESSESSESSESLDLGLELEIKLGESIVLDNVTEELSEVKEFEQPLDLNEVKKINIMDLEEVKSIHSGEHNDYKKMSVQKLRTLVVERNLVADSSKMKKPELLKLLESEEKEEKEEKVEE